MIEDELAQGSLVVACARPWPSQRAYHLVRPEGSPNNPAVALFQDWLVQAAGGG